MHLVRRSLLVLLIAAVWSACSEDAAPRDAGVGAEEAVRARSGGTSVPELPPQTGEAPADPVAAVVRFLPGSSGWCVQIRSAPTRLEADRIAGGIREKLSLDVALIDVDLGERGVWWRICVGHEPDEATAERQARAWTGPQGVLRPFMDDVAPGQAAYQVLEKKGLPARSPSKEMALALIRARPDAERRPLMVTANGKLFGVVTLPPNAVGASDVAVIAEDGDVLGYVPTSAPEGCEACRAALANGSPSRRLLGAGDVAAAPGEELLVEERSGDDDAVLSVFAVEGGVLKRVAWLLLGTSTAGLRVLGDARALDADGEPGLELALTRLELPILGDRLCALRERVEVLDLRRSPARKLDVTWAHTMGVAEQSGGALPARRLVAALDELGDADAGSRVCAAYLKVGRDSTLASLCIARVSELLARGRVVAAVNAAGLLSEASEVLRPAVAGPFYNAASALEEDPRLDVSSGDCEAAPLVESVQGKRLEHLVKLARVRARERVLLADLLPEVFVTGVRDFGPEAPVGQLASSWMGRLKERMPARHAAIEAKLGAASASATAADSPAAGTAPSTAEPTKRKLSGPAPGEVSSGTPPSQRPAGAPAPKGGYIHIEVHDDEPAGSEGDDGDRYGGEGAAP